MQVQVNTDSNIEAPEHTVDGVEAEVRSVLGHLADRVTRLEVHLSDQSAGRSTGADKRCLLEARPAGSAPVAVTAQADTIDGALREAAHKLKTLLGKETADTRRTRDTIRGTPPGEPTAG